MRVFRSFLAAVCAAFLICVAFFTEPCRADEHHNIDNQPGAGELGAEASAELFETKFTTLNGETKSLITFKGQRLLINFWATWCGPCRDEAKLLRQARARLKARGITLVAIAAEDDAEKVREFVKREKLPYPVLFGEKPAINLMTKLGNDLVAIPYTLAVSSEGVLLKRKKGVLRERDLNALILAFKK